MPAFGLASGCQGLIACSHCCRFSSSSTVSRNLCLFSLVDGNALSCARALLSAPGAISFFFGRSFRLCSADPEVSYAEQRDGECCDGGDEPIGKGPLLPLVFPELPLVFLEQFDAFFLICFCLNFLIPLGPSAYYDGASLVVAETALVRPKLGFGFVENRAAE
ncbi:MAG: hypothetical protein AAF583_01910 [Pseudomonadota bacterium]